MLGVISTLSHGRRAPATVFVVIALAVFSITQIVQLKVGNPVEGSSLLWEDSEYNVAVSRINANFAGLNTLEVVFEAKDPNNPSRVARQADTVFSMLELQRVLEKQEFPPVATLSFADYLPEANRLYSGCLLYTSPSPRDQRGSRMPSSA